MSETVGTYSLVDNETLTTTSGEGGGPDHFYLLEHIGALDRITFQWALSTAAAIGPACSFTFYSSQESDIRRVRDASTTAAADVWADETPYGATFARVPGTTAPDSDRLPLNFMCTAHLLVKVTVLSTMTGFSLRATGVG